MGFEKPCLHRGDRVDRKIEKQKARARASERGRERSEFGGMRKKEEENGSI